MTTALANPLRFGMMRLPSIGEHAMRTPDTTEGLDRRLCVLMVDVQAGDRRAYAELLRDCEPFIRRVGRRAGW